MVAGSLTAAAIILGAGLLAGGCPDHTTPDDQLLPFFHNTTDPTNDGAQYIGSAACSACHSDVAAQTRIHGHSHALNAVQGRAPEYAPEATRANVPQPPAGSTWNDISYVISGYLHNALFVDQAGYVKTTGVDGVDSSWQLDFPANGTAAGFTAYLPDQATPKPYDYTNCFRCHTTGPQPQDPAAPRSQDGRIGILGTWAEANVQCEACHGPGSFHAPQPQRRNIFVDSSAAFCGRCHTGGTDPNGITATAGFLDGNGQYPQLLASGGHSKFACTVCHNPHASITYERPAGLRNNCTTCHTDVNLAFHDGAVFEFGDYVEEVTCASCHMPLAGRSSSSASAAIVGDEARIGDVRAHIFRINATDTTANAFLPRGGSTVVVDATGQAAVTVDFVCLRCHHDGSNVFSLTFNGAARIAHEMHAKASAANEP